MDTAIFYIISVRNTISFNAIFGLDFKGKCMLPVMRVVMFPFMGLKSSGTLMKCVWKQERNQGGMFVHVGVEEEHWLYLVKWVLACRK